MRRFLSSLLFLIGLTLSCTAAVLIDVSAVNPASGAGTFVTWTNALNIGSGPNGSTNLVLVCGAQFVDGNAGTSSMLALTWNAVSMTEVGTGIGNGNGGEAHIFQLVNPITGTHNIVATWMTTNEVVIECASFVGADQTGGSTTFYNVTTNTGSAGSNTVTITSNSTNDGVLASHVGNGNFGSSGGTSGVTNIGNSNTGTIQSGAGNYATGLVGPVTLTYSGVAGNWASMAVGIKAFGSAPSCQHLSLLGVGC